MLAKILSHLIDVQRVMDLYSLVLNGSCPQNYDSVGVNI